MKTKTVVIIGAILFCLVVRNEIVTMLVLLALLIPVVFKVLEAAAMIDDPEYRNKHQ